MFDLLKKKLGKFTEKVKQRIEKRPAAKGRQPEEAVSGQEEEKILKRAAQSEAKEEEKILEAAVPSEAKEELPPEERVISGGKEAVEAAAVAKIKEFEIVKPAEEKRRLKPKVGIKGKLKAAITGAVQLEERDLKDLLWELELALLEADVEQTTSEEICREIRERLVGKKISRGKRVEDVVRKEIGEILLQMMQTAQFDLVKEAKAKREKPYKILFLGPNGAGKTTSIAKLTHLLQSKGLKVIWAAGDTFRAASIEQLEKHAQRLNVRVIKHQYGADPAAVAFDAVKAAQSRHIDAVLIDSAGRQETNRNLMGELQKIVRVIQPDLKIYVGEAFTGQALLQQAKEYDKIVGIDGFILTKIDCDSKGGTTISLLYKLKKPILFVGTGQEYKDLKRFEPEFVLSRVMG